MTRKQIEKGLKTGHTLVIDRRDAPELQDLLDLEQEGKVTQEFVQFDEQSSGVRWRWVK